MKLIVLASSLLLADPYMAPRPPERFTGNTPQAISVFYADPAVVDATCKALAKRNAPNQQIPPGWTVFGCTNIPSRVTILPDPCGPQYAAESFAALACHEKGHAQGWQWEYG